MSSSFSVYPAKLRKNGGDLEAALKIFKQSNEEILLVKNNLSFKISSSSIGRSLQEVYEKNEQICSGLESLAGALEQIAKLYETTENKLLGITNSSFEIQDIPGGEFTWDNVSDWWSDIWDMTEQGLTSMPDWMRALLMTNPGTNIIGALPYILENDFLKTAIWQALAGDFTDESNLLGTALSVGIGFVPVVGQIADVRDLIADVYNLIDDGPKTSEWIALGFTLVGIIPGIGDFLKHGDEIGDVVKHGDEIGDVVKHGDEIGDGIKRAKDIIGSGMDKIDELKEAVENGIKKISTKADNAIKQHLSDETLNNIKKGWNKMKEIGEKKFYDEHTMTDFTKEMLKEESENLVEDGADWIENYRNEGHDEGYYDRNFPGILRMPSFVM